MNSSRILSKWRCSRRWILNCRTRNMQTASFEPVAKVDGFSSADSHQKTDPSASSMDNDILNIKIFGDEDDPFEVKSMVTVNDLLKARVHLGHHAGCWSRYVRPYLYGIRNGIHIFNLDTTLANLHRALEVAGHMAYQRRVILFVNERPQFEALTQFTARECKEYYVTKWRPGTLTNSYKLLQTMRVPDLMIFLSVPRSKTAVKEALTQGIPIVGIVDSDCNPNFILYPVPGNDDSLPAMQLYCELFGEVIKRAKMLRDRDDKMEMQEKERKHAVEIEMQEHKDKEINKELRSVSNKTE